MYYLPFFMSTLSTNSIADEFNRLARFANSTKMAEKDDFDEVSPLVNSTWAQKREAASQLCEPPSVARAFQPFRPRPLSKTIDLSKPLVSASGHFKRYAPSLESALHCRCTLVCVCLHHTRWP